MKIERATIYRCDRCGTESQDGTVVANYPVPGREMDCEGKDYSPAIVRRDLCKNCFKMLCAVTKMYFADCVDAPGGEYSELPKSKGDTE